MNFQIVGCSHHTSSLQLREQLAFSSDDTRLALRQLREQFPQSEVVLMSTCNRVELYTGSTDGDLCPSPREITEFIADFHGLNAVQLFAELFDHSGEEAVQHLFATAASLDSMVVGEPQILAQVKHAYEMATGDNCTGPLTHGVFQAAMRVAKRVASETTIHQRRTSIASVAINDFSSRFFDRYDDQHILVIGAGEIGSETLQYLLDQGARDITVINRNWDRAQSLAEDIGATAQPWEQLSKLLSAADLVVSTTAATEHIVTAEQFEKLHPLRHQRTLLILDLAVPRDFDPAIADFLGVYLYSIDDLQGVCQENRQAREREWPKAQQIIHDEAFRFMADARHRSTSPWIHQLKTQADSQKEKELLRLFNKLEQLDEATRDEIRQSFDRLTNKLLHPPLESLRHDTTQGGQHGLLDALKRLFQLRD
ncbi:MAG: glutamyl-tRNA reductase [Pirellulaceae bacterium]